MYLTDVNGPCRSAVPRPAAKRKPSVANGPKSAVPPTGVEVRRIGLFGESDKRTDRHVSSQRRTSSYAFARCISVRVRRRMSRGALGARENEQGANRREIARGDER